MRAAASSKFVSAGPGQTGFPVCGCGVPAARGLRSGVNVDRLPADVAGHVGGEEYCGTGDLVDMTGTPHRENIADAGT